MNKEVLTIGKDEYGEYYQGYIEKGKAMAGQMDLLQHGSGIVRFLREIPKEKYDYRYAEGKWSIKEIVGHLIDTERIFCFRALAFARGEQAAIVGYDHEAYVQESKAQDRQMEDLLEELISVRVATHHLFNSFDDATLKRFGNANGMNITVRAIYLIMYGHAMHHIVVIKEKYL